MQIYTALLEMVVGCLITIFVSHSVCSRGGARSFNDEISTSRCRVLHHSKTGTSYESTVSNEVLHLGYLGKFLAGDADPLYKIEQSNNLHTSVREKEKDE